MTTDDLQNVLAIDSSTSVLKLGLQFQSDRMVKSGEQVEQSHGQMIIRKIQNLLEAAALSIDAGVQPRQVDVEALQARLKADGAILA